MPSRRDTSSGLLTGKIERFLSPSSLDSAMSKKRYSKTGGDGGAGSWIRPVPAWSRHLYERGKAVGAFLAPNRRNRASRRGNRNWGYFYYKKKEYRKAHHWFSKAKKAPVSQYYLGLIFYFGKGEFARNREKAYHFFDRAATAGYVLAKYTKGYILYHGQGARKDRRLGIKWLKEAAEIGDPEARKLLEKWQR